MNIYWTDEALENIRGHVNRIRDFASEECADEWKAGMIESASVLADFPYIGKKVREYTEDENDVREIIYKGYRLVYEVVGNNVHILAVYYSRQKHPSYRSI